MQKTIFITGTSSGLGKASALLFAKNGWNVIATMRNPDAEKELNQVENIRLLKLDVTDPTSIEETIEELLKTTKIDVVFNNAGYGLGGPFEGATDEQISLQFNTNVMGVMRVCKAFIPHFREQKKGLFLTTTSIGGNLTFPLFSVYHATKWALEGWSESLSYELGEFGIVVKTLAPGGIKTDFAGRSLVLSQHKAYDSMMEKAVKAFNDPQRQKSNSSPEQIAAVAYQAVTDGKNQVRYFAGKDAKQLIKVRKLFGTAFFMKQVRKTFFGK